LLAVEKNKQLKIYFRFKLAIRTRKKISKNQKQKNNFMIQNGKWSKLKSWFKKYRKNKSR
jgi:hypothetical protein